MKINQKQKAQSTLEYILILTAVVGLILYAAAQWIFPNVQTAINNTQTAIGNVAGKL